jgi:VWFA-related protein
MRPVASPRFGNCHLVGASRTTNYSLCLVLCFTAGGFGQVVSSPARNPITVPVLVEGRSGEITYDLSAGDFSIKDEGIEQRVLAVDPAQRPLSLVLVIQTGHDVTAQLKKIGRLDSLLGSFLTEPSDQAAIVTFDSSVFLLQDFTANADLISKKLSNVQSGNAGASVFDALSMATKLLSQTPVTSSRVILLISRERDHGSFTSDAGSVVRGVASVGVSVYSLTSTAGKKELFTGLRSLNPSSMKGSSMQKNTPEALAELTGGDFYHFSTERDFEDRTIEIADHIHNRYCLSFVPSKPIPGFHSLEVEVHREKANVVSARSGYWIPIPGEPENSRTGK